MNDPKVRDRGDREQGGREDGIEAAALWQDRREGERADRDTDHGQNVEADGRAELPHARPTERRRT
jgi:hypothetical protein